MRARFCFTAVFLSALLFGCATPGTVLTQAQLTPATETFRDLTHLPPPRGKVVASVYGFRDMTGQYKAAPNSNLSSAMTQGAASFMIKALHDSGWFITVEREGLQNLLTERKVIRAINNGKNVNIGNLLPANILIEGGIVAYESNVKTGGIGAKYLGISGAMKYRSDQVTVNLRAVDVRSGRILDSIMVTKTIFSHQLDSGIFRFIAFKSLLEAEAGYSFNEPAQLSTMEAIQTAVIHLIVRGVREKSWFLLDANEENSDIFQKYVGLQTEHDEEYVEEPAEEVVEEPAEKPVEEVVEEPAEEVVEEVVEEPAEEVVEEAPAEKPVEEVVEEPVVE